MFADELHYLVTDAHKRNLTGHIGYTTWGNRFSVKINDASVSQVRPRAYRRNKDLAIAISRAAGDFQKLFANAGEAVLLDRDTRAELFTQLFNIPITNQHGGLIDFIFNFADRGLDFPFIVRHGSSGHIQSFSEEEALKKAIEAASKSAGMVV